MNLVPNLRLILTIAVAVCCVACTKRDSNDDGSLIGVDDSPISVIGAPVQVDLSRNTQVVFSLPPYHKGGYAYGSTVRTGANSLLMACTKFGEFDDFRESHIVAKKSTDNGKTWTKEYNLVNNLGTVNTAAPALLGITEKHIMVFFSAKNGADDIGIYVKESFDGGETWGAHRKISKEKGYYLLNNDRAIYNQGRIILPMAFTDHIFRNFDKQVVFCYYSDDLGKTWHKSGTLKTNTPLMEPVITPVKGGQLLMAIRTLKGFIFFSKSSDNGVTWHGIYKSGVISPESPQALVRVHASDTLVMIWNHNKPNGVNHHDRNPLTMAFSTDAGTTWKKAVNIQNDNKFNFSYPSILVYDNIMHITYTVMDRQTASPSLYYNRLSVGELFR